MAQIDLLTQMIERRSDMPPTHMGYYLGVILKFLGEIMDTNLKNALIIIGVLFLIYLVVSPTKNCVREQEPFKSYEEWKSNKLFADKKIYLEEKRDYEAIIKRHCRGRHSW